MFNNENNFEKAVDTVKEKISFLKENKKLKFSDKVFLRRLRNAKELTIFNRIGMDIVNFVDSSNRKWNLIVTPAGVAYNEIK